MNSRDQPPAWQQALIDRCYHPTGVWESCTADEIGQAVDIDDPFLELGGNSLQAMRIAARVQDKFGVEIPLTELFAAATVAEMGLVMTATLLNHTQVKSSESNE